MSGIQGRKAKLYVGTKGEAATTVTNGNLYFVKAVDASASVLPAKVGAPFIASGSLTLADDDEVYPLSISEVGVVKDKGASQSKGTLESTTDEDENKTYISDMLSDETVSFSGNSTADSDKNLADFEKVFSIVTVGDGAGSFTVNEVNDDPIWLVFDYTSRGRANGDNLKMKVVPTLLTSGSLNANPESVQDFSFDGQSAGEDADGSLAGLIYDSAVVS